jgi:hypothetical protein
MRPPGSIAVIALCALLALVATQALGQEPEPAPPSAAPPAAAPPAAAPPATAPSSTTATRRTLQLGPGSTIQYEAEPGDERSAGTFNVLPMPAVPAEGLPSAERVVAAQEPRDPEAAAPSVRAVARPCDGPRSRLAVRLLQLRGLEVDEVTAPWILQRLAFYGDGLPLSALQSDLFARNLAVELAHCEAAH